MPKRNRNPMPKRNRYPTQVEQVAAEQLEVINTLYRTDGDTFIDPNTGVT